MNLSGPAQPSEGPNVALLNRFRISAYLGILVVFIAVTIVNHSRSVWALAVVINVAIVNHFRSMRVLPATWHESALFIAQVVLFLTLAVLAIRWVLATHHELKLWLRWLDNPTEKREAYAAIAILSVTLGVCLAYAFNIVFISSILTTYLLINYWTQWLSNDHFARALPGTRRRLQSEPQSEPQSAALQVLEVLEHYWLKRPQLARITTMMFFSSGAFSAALAGYLHKEPQKQECFQLVAYAVLILDVLIGEVFIAWWRHKRDQWIKQAEEGKLEVNFNLPEDDLAKQADEDHLRSKSSSAYSNIFFFAFGGLALAQWIYTSNDHPGLKEFFFPLDLRSMLFLVSVLFGIELLALCRFWIEETENELVLWIKWLENPVQKKEVTTAIIGLALVLGMALAFFYSIVFISAFMTIYLLINYWTQWVSNDHFDRALERTKRTLELAKDDPSTPTKSRVLNVMKVYWVDLPQLKRITTLMFVASMGFALALAGYVQEEPMRHRLYLASYGVLFLDILVGEIVIFRWRRKRDRDIAQAQQSEEQVHNV